MSLLGETEDRMVQTAPYSARRTGIPDDSTRQVATRAIDGRMKSGYMATAFRTASLAHPPFNENSFPRSGGSKKAKNPTNTAFLQ